MNRLCVAAMLLLAGHFAVADPMALWHSGQKQAAIDQWRTLAEQGDHAASLALGDVYRTGAGVEVNDAIAADWYRRAAERGEPAAQFELGLMYELGLGVVQDSGEAAYWYGLANAQGCPDELRAGVRPGRE